MCDPAAAPAPDLLRTPLDALHRALGARMVAFANYAMPVNYPSGIIGEHLHTRAQAGLFDVSHMGQCSLEGSDAARRLEGLVPGDIAALEPGRMRYTQFLDDEGHILDDLMVTRQEGEGASERLYLVVNAATKAADFAHLAALLPDLKLETLDDRALLALQGPSSAHVLSRFLPGVETLPFLSAKDFIKDGVLIHISRSGYTGEDGFEISLAGEAAPGFAEMLLAEPEVLPIGLGARDSLRLEAGLCLYGHDIDRTINPIEAGLLWSIPKHRREAGGFLGFEAIRRAIKDGPRRKRVGFLLEGKAPAREGSEVLNPQGEAIGHITSGGFAPSLGRPIAMGYVNAAQTKIDDPVQLMVRGKPLSARVAPLPFVPHRYHRGA
jgi:aminomethyltransferase